VRVPGAATPNDLSKGHASEVPRCVEAVRSSRSRPQRLVGASLAHRGRKPRPGFRTTASLCRSAIQNGGVVFQSIRLGTRPRSAGPLALRKKQPPTRSTRQPRSAPMDNVAQAVQSGALLAGKLRSRQGKLCRNQKAAASRTAVRTGAAGVMPAAAARETPTRHAR